VTGILRVEIGAGAGRMFGKLQPRLCEVEPEWSVAALHPVCAIRRQFSALLRYPLLEVIRRSPKRIPEMEIPNMGELMARI
jgi:hypothetical protein